MSGPETSILNLSETEPLSSALLQPDCLLTAGRGLYGNAVHAKGMENGGESGEKISRSGGGWYVLFFFVEDIAQSISWAHNINFIPKISP